MKQKIFASKVYLVKNEANAFVFKKIRKRCKKPASKKYSLKK
jgi:hypothetical protein